MAAAAGFVNGIAQFSDDALEPAAAHLFEELQRIALDFRGLANRFGGVAQEAAHLCAPLVEWLREEIVAVEMQ